MQTFVVLGLSLILTIFGSMEYQKYSNSNRADITDYNNDFYAGNLFIYNDLAISYLMVNYDKIYNGTLPADGNISYATSNNFDYNNTLKNYSYFSYKPVFNYKSTYFLYTPAASTTDQNPIPVLYLITSWDVSGPNLTNRTNDQLSAAMLSSLSQSLSDKISNGNSTYWSIPIIGSQKNGGNIQIFMNLDTATKAKYSSFFSLMQYKLSSNYNVGQYFYLTPVVKQQ